MTASAASLLGQCSFGGPEYDLKSFDAMGRDKSKHIPAHVVDPPGRTPDHDFLYKTC